MEKEEGKLNHGILKQQFGVENGNVDSISAYSSISFDISGFEVLLMVADIDLAQYFQVSNVGALFFYYFATLTSNDKLFSVV